MRPRYSQLIHPSIVLLFTAFLLLSCKTIKPIEFKGIKSAKIEKVSLTGAALKLNIELYNPNPVKVKFKKGKLSFKLDEVDFGEVYMDSAFQISAGEKLIIPIHTQSEFKNLFDGLFSKVQKIMGNPKEVPLHIKGFVVGSAYYIPMRIPIRSSQKIDLLGGF